MPVIFYSLDGGDSWNPILFPTSILAPADVAPTPDIPGASGDIMLYRINAAYGVEVEGAVRIP
jgi:hypothetical protein